MRLTIFSLLLASTALAGEPTLSMHSTELTIQIDDDAIGPTTLGITHSDGLTLTQLSLRLQPGATGHIPRAYLGGQLFIENWAADLYIDQYIYSAADLNCDGEVTDADLSLFFTLLSTGYDYNGDGDSSTDSDITAFFAALSTP